MKVVVAIPHSHTWFWSSTCISALKRNLPLADGYRAEIVVVDNSPWSPAIRAVCNTALGDSVTIIPNHKSNRFHASALDCVVEDFDFDYLMAMETDVLVLRPYWLQWFMDQMLPTDYAVGMWHHEQFVNPSCTLYRGDVLRAMMKWCKNHPNPNGLRWWEGFDREGPLDSNLPLAENPAEALQHIKDWIAGPFAEKRGWPPGTTLKEVPSGQMKGPGWYEPGQQLHHWAVEAGHTYAICPSLTTTVTPGLPLQTLYGATIPDPRRQLEAAELFGKAYTAHLWGGTRALDILKHPVSCEFVKANTPMWLAREARYWRDIVPTDIRTQILDLIRQYGWYYHGQGSDVITDRDRQAERYVKECYEAGGVTW